MRLMSVDYVATKHSSRLAGETATYIDEIFCKVDHLKKIKSLKANRQQVQTLYSDVQVSFHRYKLHTLQKCPTV